MKNKGNSMIRIRISIIGILTILIMSCKNEPIKLDYCKMIAEDQTFVNTDKSDMEQFDSDKLKRREIFKKNFNLIMEKTRQDGFPFVSIENYQNDSCKYWAVSMTMIHTAQSNPELFFSKKYANIFKSELDKGNIERRLLEQSSIITSKTIELCEELQSEIKYATNLWGIDYSIFNDAKFIKCK